ncbi:hypothetical protein YK48G_16830 [Lentilactobacillus fungorum]|uniref:Uncharacterized protein n=1 Tax=Lentilactobacillus fungorum TaxID=2201250 RepID=A0ABQ3W0S6_9LACO|nr:hypothetical protein [Lentilactobacillus fungorum]GHP14258.1 hypothetical protein YK48G_16830 [Lentilactobacillus fungorum]
MLISPILSVKNALYEIQAKKLLATTTAGKDETRLPLLEIFNRLGQCHTEFKRYFISNAYEFKYLLITVLALLPCMGQSKHPNADKGQTLSLILAILHNISI